MKIILPNGKETKLDTSLELNERKMVVDEILTEWKHYFENSWELNKTRVCLEVLSNYLCMVKDGENKNKEDKHIMSSTKMKKLNKFNDKSINFSNLPKGEQQLFGLLDSDEDGEKNE